MNLRKHLLEAATLIVAAVLCALVSNAIASRERKLALVGSYPNAQKVPEESAAPGPTASPSPATETASATVAVQPETTAPLTMTIAPVTQTVVSTTTAPPKAAAPRTAATPTAPTATAPPPAPAATAKSTPADLTKRFPPHPDKAYVEIAYADADALHNAGALFLDARRTSVYEQGHIAGARPFSVWESDIDDKVRKLFDERSDVATQALPIVVYCSGGECEDSHMLAQKLWGIEFNNVYVYRDGFPDWQKRGGAVHTGQTP